MGKCFEKGEGATVLERSWSALERDEVGALGWRLKSADYLNAQERNQWADLLKQQIERKLRWGDLKAWTGGVFGHKQ